MSGIATASARRLDTYTRFSLYVVLALQPAVYLGAFPAVGPVAGIVVGSIQAAANIVVCHRSLTKLHQGRRSLTRSEKVAFSAWLALSAFILIMVTMPGWQDTGSWVLAVYAATAAPLATVAARLSVRLVLLSSVLLSGLLAVVGATRGGLSAPAAIGFALGGLVLLVLLAMTFWLSGWMLRNIWELEEARQTVAQLAIAQERLRISRDLHDLFGRTMTTVAVKTELAGELVRRGRTAAALDQLADVRSVAAQASQQVRAVVHGYREDDLATELAGARSLLDAAGIRCVVRGTPPPDLSAATTSALVWVLREAVTNVIRHSVATECLITIERGDPVRLIITNDGAQAADNDHRGHGLLGMRERLAAAGGELRSASALGSGRFTVEVTVPHSTQARA